MAEEKKADKPAVKEVKVEKAYVRAVYGLIIDPTTKPVTQIDTAPVEVEYTDWLQVQIDAGKIVFADE